MKKFMRSIQTLAALLIAMAATMACTSDDNTIDGPTPETTAAPKTYTLTIEATKSSDDTATRALSLDGTGALIATWKTTDEVTVMNETPGRQADLGTLTPQSEGATTTLTGTLTGDIQEGDDLFLSIERDGDWADPMDGTLAYISDHFDVASCNVHVASVDASDNITLTEGTADFANAIAVVRFHLADKAGNPLNASALAINIPSDYYWVPSNYTLSGMTNATYAANAYGSNTGDGVVYAAISGCDSKTVTLTATVGAQTYTYSRAGVTFENGKFYDITVKMGKLVNLSTVASGFTAQDGDVLTGTAENKNIQIADGASVTLSGVTITDRDHPGITCQGDATITLVGTNSVTNTNVAYIVGYPAIQAGPSGTTLEIKGGGSLTATGGGYAAGIGSGNNGTCGDITISGGSLTATASLGAAGIGSGDNGTCGDITISGGTVTATGGEDAAGIGSGKAGTCGDITISGGTVTATGGGNAAGIGAGFCATCGDITISGGTITANGGKDAPGIGSGSGAKLGSNIASCGDITISGGSGTATGGTGSQEDIGAGNYGSTCGTVSVAPGTISRFYYEVVECQLTLMYYQIYPEDTGGPTTPPTPAYNVNADNIDITITVTIDGHNYTAIGKYTAGSTVTIFLPRVENKTITVTSANTGYDNSEYAARPVGGSQPTADFVGTLSGVTITAGSTNNLGTVNLIKQ